MASTPQQIYVLRHAEAEPEAATDELRPLTSKGIKQAKAVGRFCTQHQITPRFIISSPLVRAEETANLVAKELDISDAVRVEGFLRPGMTTAFALSSLEKYSDAASIMMIGHEPDLSAFVGDLIGSRAEGVHVRKASLIQLSVSGLAPGAGTLEFFIPVKYL